MAEEAPLSPPDIGGGRGQDDNPNNINSRDTDRFVPIANISRIMKKALPRNGKMAKEAKDTVQECVSEFISFITSEASEDYLEPLKVYLAKYRELEGEAKTPVKGEGPAKRDSPACGGNGTGLKIKQDGSFTEAMCHHLTSQATTSQRPVASPMPDFEYEM